MTKVHTPDSNASNHQAADGVSTTLLVTPSGLLYSINNGNVNTAITNLSNNLFDSKYNYNIASPSEVSDGVNTYRLVTPFTLLSSINTAGTVNTAIKNIANNQISIAIATNQEVIDGVSTNKLVTPNGLLNAINNAGAIKSAVSTIATTIATTIANTQIANALPVRTYKDVTATRQQDVTYTNTTNTDLIVIVNVVGGVNFIHSLWVGGLIVCSRYAATSAGYVYYGTLEATIPAGGTYLYNSSAAGQIQQWIELSAN
jgi:hypothetical protein